jgi:hypothetical protein
LWAQLGLWRRGFGGLLSLKETLKSESLEEANGTQWTPRKSRLAAEVDQIQILAKIGIFYIGPIDI